MATKQRRATARHPYTPAWREKVRAGAKASAEVLGGLLVERYPDVREVADIGCGEGWLCQRFTDLGVTAFGFDGHADDERVIRLDLDDTLPVGLGEYDMVVCLEVAEHLPAARAGQLVEWLCTLAPIVVFSAAAPGQGGEGHVNEQWPDYWAELFAGAGFRCFDSMRWEIWNDDRIEWWYRQNIMIFTPGVGPAEPTAPVRVIHPGAWAHMGHG